jgi:hypothetical protein
MSTRLDLSFLRALHYHFVLETPVTTNKQLAHHRKFSSTISGLDRYQERPTRPHALNRGIPPCNMSLGFVSNTTPRTIGDEMFQYVNFL